jgi:hypothetical protein
LYGTTVELQVLFPSLSHLLLSYLRYPISTDVWIRVRVIEVEHNGKTCEIEQVVQLDDMVLAAILRDQKIMYVACSVKSWTAEQFFF